jgi:hypothetical protein
VTLPLFEEVPREGGGVERVPLHPELEEELAQPRAAATSATGPIVVEERSGKRYVERRMSNVHRKIRDAAGLPKDRTFTRFRHGGITEIGDAGEDDVRAGVRSQDARRHPYLQQGERGKSASDRRRTTPAYRRNRGSGRSETKMSLSERVSETMSRRYAL